MYLLFVDDSGSVDDKNIKHCVLAGFAVYETRPFWIEKAIDDLVRHHIPTYPEIAGDLFTQVASRFDMFLGRMHRKHDSQRGIAIFDKSTRELTIQRASYIFSHVGHQWGGRLNNFATVPLFLDSKMSRLIQLADLIAFSIFRHFEYNDDTYFSIIKNCFDADEKNIHGLHTLI